jgi:ribosomal protein S18 acetylase RimI-like enzyme
MTSRHIVIKGVKKMEITYKFYEKIEDAALEKQIMALLLETDHEFLPSLSSKRTRWGKEKTQEDLLEIYLEQKKNENQFILAFDGDKVVAFLNFVPRYYLGIAGNYSLSHYIDTISVSKDYRNKGIANALYDYIENDLPEEASCNFLTVSTWSTQETQKHILEKKGYELLEVVEHARERDIHTLFYGKRRQV